LGTGTGTWGLGALGITCGIRQPENGNNGVFLLDQYAPRSEILCAASAVVEDWVIRYFQGKELKNDGIKYKRARPILTENGAGRVLIDTDGCGGQYYGRTNFFRMA
jgi:hypothetical protein